MKYSSPFGAKQRRIRKTRENDMNFSPKYFLGVEKVFLDIMEDSHNHSQLFIAFLRFIGNLTSQALLPLIIFIPLPFGAVNPVIRIILIWLWGTIISNWWDKEIYPLLPLENGDSQKITPFVEIPDEIDVPSFDGGTENQSIKNYTWEFTPASTKKVVFSIEARIDVDRYNAARQEERRTVWDWAYYVFQDMPELRSMAKTFFDLHTDQNWSTFDQAANVLSFTQQCIDYRSDEDTTPAKEWPRYPIETLMDEVGDCEDDVILAAAILKRLGFEVALLYYPRHCALGVGGAKGLPGEYIVDTESGISYFYGETTSTGWKLGEVPDKYRGLEPERIEVVHTLIDFDIEEQDDVSISDSDSAT